MDDLTRRVMQMLCDGINPALLLSVLSEVPMALSGATPDTRKATLARAASFVAVGCATIAVPVVLAEIGKHYVIWAGHPGFPSGHTTFSAAASAAIVAYRGAWWLLLAVPATGAMMVSLVYLKHHDLLEVLGVLVLGAGLAWAITRGCAIPR